MKIYDRGEIVAETLIHRHKLSYSFLEIAGNHDSVLAR